jgi:Rieske Fe-S protein
VSATSCLCLGGCHPPEEPKRIVPIARLDSIKPGQNIFYIERIILIRDENSLSAMSINCTHQACTLNPSAAGWSCPCHASQFDSAGKVLQGPAAEDLPWYSITVDEKGMVRVNFGERVPPEWRYKLSA